MELILTSTYNYYKGFIPTEFDCKKTVVLQSLHSYGVIAFTKLDANYRKPQRGNTFVIKNQKLNQSTVGAIQTHSLIEN